MTTPKRLNNIKLYLSNNNWTRDFFFDILSTIVGIALTIGVAAYVEYRKDRQQAREMMFNVVRQCQESEKMIAMYDTTFHKQAKAVDVLIKLYHDNGNDLSKIPDDTLNIKYMISLNGFIMPEYVWQRTQTENYFYSAQMMHQFGNTQLYTEFADFVQMDKQTYEQVVSVANQWLALSKSLDNKQFADGKSLGQTLNELIEDHELPEYGFNLRFSTLQVKLRVYQYYSRRLLKAMGATQEDLDEYVKENSTVKNDENVDTHYVDSERE